MMVKVKVIPRSRTTLHHDGKRTVKVKDILRDTYSIAYTCRNNAILILLTFQLKTLNTVNVLKQWDF